jgi:heterodisulfide reductase subunit B
VKYAYYPGCSLEKNSAAYDVSVRAVADLLGIKLMEIDDWNCCGATEYFSQDELVACSVIARNLALVDPQLDQVVAPCAACYLLTFRTSV